MTEHGLTVNAKGDDAYIEYTDADGTVHEYPGNYGLTECSAWDLELEPDCADENGPLEGAPEWCADSWCYVNKQTCFSAQRSTYFPDAYLWYTYDACVEDEEADQAGEEEGEQAAEGDGEQAAEGEGDQAAEEEGEQAAEEEGEQAAEEEEEELNPVGSDEFFDQLDDFLRNGGTDDCSCLMEHGQTVHADPDTGDAYIIYVDENGDEIRYPATYGLVECMAFDEDLEPFCVDEDGEALEDAPEFCGQRWCYVNAKTCDSFILSSTFPGSGLAYSFDACVDDSPAAEEEEEGALVNDIPEDEECGCISSPGIPVEFDENGNGKIVYVDADTGDEFDYPPNYGSTFCQAWDEELQPTCADESGDPLADAPATCSLQWCYVNELTCLTGTEASTAFPDVEGLSFNYKACALRADEGGDDADEGAQDGDESAQDGDEGAQDGDESAQDGDEGAQDAAEGGENAEEGS